jgi:hypothetical protein
MVRTGLNLSSKKKIAEYTTKIAEKRYLSFSTIMERSQWRSIMLLTYNCGKNGLEAAHYRWALVKNHGNLADRPTRKKFEMEKFFRNREVDEGLKEFYNLPSDEEECEKWMNRYCEVNLVSVEKFYYDLEYLYQKEFFLSESTIIKDCISSNSNLSNYLKKLSGSYGILEKRKDEHNTNRYFLSGKFINEMYRYGLNQGIKKCPDSVLDRLVEHVTFFFKCEINRETDPILSKF